MCVELFAGAVAQHLEQALLVVQAPEIRMVSRDFAVLEKFEHT